MKKLFILILCIISLLLSSCSIVQDNEIGYDISDNVKKAGIKAVDIVDKYLSFDINGDEAQNQLDSLEKRCIEQKDDDSFVKSDIGFMSYDISNIESTAPRYESPLEDENYTTRKTRELVIQRNDLAVSFLNLKAIEVPYSTEPEKINISDLCQNASNYDNRIITTTIFVNSTYKSELIYNFEKSGYNSASVSFNTYGFNCKKATNDFITITGCVSYTSDSDEYFSVDIVALNDKSVLDTVDKSLFTDLDK